MASVVDEQYSWKPSVVDLADSLAEAGVRVYVFDNDGTIVVNGDTINTDAGGTIAEQFLINQIRTDSGTGFVQNLETPHKIRLSKYTGTFGLNIVAIQSTINSPTEPTFFVEQNPNITINETTVAGYTNITINDATDEISLGAARTLEELYHFAFREATINPEFDFDEIVATGDGNNFSCVYDINITAGTFDLGGGSLTMVGGKTIVLVGTSNITNGSVSGTVGLDAAINLSNLSADAIVVNVAANTTLTFDNVQCPAVQNDSTTGTLTINSVGGSNLTATDPGTGVGQTNILAGQATLTLTGLELNSEVRVYTAGTQTELDGVENSGTTFAYTYTYVPSTFVDIVIFNVDYDPIKLLNVELGAADASVPIQQSFDRWYNNPP